MSGEPREVKAGTPGVADQFDRGAARYDLMTALNPGYHRHLRRAARMLAAAVAEDGGPDGRDATVLDVGCGSGSSTRAAITALAERDVPARITGIDASAGMLARARVKPWPSTVSFVCRPAESLAELAGSGGPDGVDGILAAYLFRNVTDPDQVAAQMFDRLRPGGSLVVQEYSVADSRRARWVWTAVCRGVVIPLSTVLRGNRDLYRYLWRSVVEYESLATFCRRLTRAGFVDVEVVATPGWQRGILHTIRGRRPSRPRPDRGERC